MEGALLKSFAESKGKSPEQTKPEKSFSRKEKGENEKRKAIIITGKK